jgi:lipoprotein-anchoring transpeptidase ErfK/SrfK
VAREHQQISEWLFESANLFALFINQTKANKAEGKITMATRRHLIFMGLAFIAATTAAQAEAEHPFYGGAEDTRDPALFPPAESLSDFPIKSFEETLPQKFRRQVVSFGTPEKPGTIIVDPEHRYLYFILPDSQAIRYGVGVGREGFAWSGEAYIGLKRKWPRWLPPTEMVTRDVHAAEWANGMPGGPENPLGARALYLHANKIDTLYRIHGTNDPASIGKAMSSGCVRMLNEDIADLFDRAPLHTKVIVLSPGSL